MATFISMVSNFGSLSNNTGLLRIQSSSHGLSGCAVFCGWHQDTFKRHGIPPLRPRGCSSRLLNKYHALAHASTQEGGNQDSVTLKGTLSGVLQENLAPIQKFPWRKFCERLAVHTAEYFWITSKWIFVPLLVLSAVVEIVLCISNGKELLIPFGLLVGTLVGGSLKEAVLSTDIQDEMLPWHILLIGLLFGLIKLSAYKFPMWLYTFFVHFGNGGLWQIVLSSIDWRKRKETRNLERAM